MLTSAVHSSRMNVKAKELIMRHWSIYNHSTVNYLASLVNNCCKVVLVQLSIQILQDRAHGYILYSRLDVTFYSSFLCRR